MTDLEQLPSGQSVCFGAGIRHEAKNHVAKLGHRRALVLSTPQQADMAMDLAQTLGDLAAGVFSGARMHTPKDTTDEAQTYATSINADCVVAIGGGSTTGLGKALALRSGYDQIVIPTTYAGSECTPILGQTENGIKTTLTDPAVLPGVVLYDPELVAGLPMGITVTSALNAMAHAAEALYAKNRSSESTSLALQGLHSFINSLGYVVKNPSDLDARKETQRGAWACGTVLGQIGMALHHKLCHTLGGSFDMPHAETHAIVLPHAIGYNETAAAAELAPIAEMLDGPSPGRALWEFSEGLGAPTALKDLGLAEADLDRAAEIATQNPYWNPREITQAGIYELLRNAWAGHPPN